MTTIAERLAWGMKQAGMEQAELARAARVSISAVGQWLDGKTKNLKMGNLFEVSRALGLNPEWLGTGKGPRLRDITRTEGEFTDAALRVAGIYASASEAYKAKLDALADEAWTARQAQWQTLKPADD